MPVITTVSTVGPVTTTTYQIDVNVSRPKTAFKVRAIRSSNGGTFSFTPLTKNGHSRIRFYKDVALSNTGPGALNPGVFPCGADYWVLPFAIPNINFNIITIGNQTGNSTICTHRENPALISGSTVFQNVYIINFPSIFPDDVCIEADLGYPFGTVHILSGVAGSTNRVTASAPPSGWVRNKDRRNWSGRFFNRAYQVRALGSQIFYQGDSVADNIDGYKIGFTPATLPSLTLAQELSCGSGLFGYNYQTNTVMRSNLTMNGRYRSMDYKNVNGGAGTFNVGGYLGASFPISFYDLNPLTQIVDLRANFGQSMPAPSIPAGKYSSFFLEITSTSDCVNAGGTTFTTTVTSQPLLCGSFGNSNSGIMNWSMGPPPYYPWDVKLRSYGTDDVTVRYARHAGYIPLASSLPAELADTVVSPILSRSGKLIILQGGLDRYPVSSRNPIASTLPITGFAYSVDPTATSFSAGEIRIRIVSKVYGAEWSTVASLSAAQEFTLASGGVGTGVYRQTANRYTDSTTYYEGPAVYLSDICLLTNIANGAQGNVATGAASSISNADSLTGFNGFGNARVSGMQGGAPSVAAKGIIQLVAVPLFADTLSIGDGVLKKVFEFGRSFQGSTMVPIGADVDTCNASLIAAINASGLAIVASIPAPTDWQAEITLLNYRDQAGGGRVTGNSWVVAVP